jgi:hypothetical protein
MTKAEDGPAGCWKTPMNSFIPSEDFMIFGSPLCMKMLQVIPLLDKEGPGGG